MADSTDTRKAPSRDDLRQRYEETIRRLLGGRPELFPHAAGFLTDAVLAVRDEDQRYADRMLAKIRDLCDERVKADGFDADVPVRDIFALLDGDDRG